jgi:transporter family-2 protein
MLAAGVGIPVLAALNAQLGARLGSPALAASVLFVVAFGCAALTTLATGASALLPRALAQPPHLYLAGTLVAFYVLAITYVAPTFGVGNAVFFVLLGQLLSAAVIDHWGLFGSRPVPITGRRALGLALMTGGVLLARRP